LLLFLVEMSKHAEISSDLSIQLGNLFYSIAKADGSLSLEEYHKLSHMLHKPWSVYGDDVTAQIKQQFNTLQQENVSPELCFEAFIKYLHSHRSEFSKALKDLIFSTTNGIAYAFSKINKSELHYMAKLSIEFKKAGL
jgi:uncharacterized tellurite resistance protein B-like protein